MRESGTSCCAIDYVRRRPAVSPRFSEDGPCAVTRVPKTHTLKQGARCANKNKTFRKQRRRYDNEPVDVDLELVGNSFPSRGEREEGGGEGEKSLTRRIGLAQLSQAHSR